MFQSYIMAFTRKPKIHGLRTYLPYHCHCSQSLAILLMLFCFDCYFIGCCCLLHLNMLPACYRVFLTAAALLQCCFIIYRKAALFWNLDIVGSSWLLLSMFSLSFQAITFHVYNLLVLRRFFQWSSRLFFWITVLFFWALIVLLLWYRALAAFCL